MKSLLISLILFASSFALGDQNLLDAGYIILRQQGINNDIDSATQPEDITAVGGRLSFPSSAASTVVVSSSTDDDGSPAGIGCQTVRVSGLDSARNAISETATMNGTTNVTLSNTYSRVNELECTAAGSGSDPNIATNLGNIQAKHGSTVLAQMDAGRGKSEQAIYSSPNDSKLYFLAGWAAQVMSKTTAQVSLLLDLRISSNAWQTIDRASVTNGKGFESKWPSYIRITSPFDIRVRALDTSADNTAVKADIKMLKRN